MPLDLSVEPLKSGAKRPTQDLCNLCPWALHDFALPRRKLRDDSTCLLPFLPKLQQGFEAQTQKPSAGGFEAQTTKPLGEAYPLCLLHDLDTCHRHPRPSDHQVLLRLRLTLSTRSTPPHALLLVDVLKCQPPMVSLPSILVPRFKPHVCPSPLFVHRHDTSLLDHLHAY
jgi:hypothetical protein